MTKGNLIATSLVGAVPAGVLAYFSIMAFVSYTEKMATMLQVVNGVTVLVSVLMALSPIAILIFMRGPAQPEAAAAGAATAAVPTAAAAASNDELAAESADEIASASAGTDDDDLSLSGFEEAPDPTSEASDDGFEFDDSEFELDNEDGK